VDTFWTRGRYPLPPPKGDYMKSFICELEKNGKVHKALVKAESEEQAINDLSSNWRVVSIKLQ